MNQQQNTSYTVSEILQIMQVYLTEAKEKKSKVDEYLTTAGGSYADKEAIRLRSHYAASRIEGMYKGFSEKFVDLTFSYSRHSAQVLKLVVCNGLIDQLDRDINQLSKVRLVA